MSTPARRRDTAVIGTMRSTYTPTGTVLTPEFEVTAVLSVTRTGMVKAVKDAWGTTRQLSSFTRLTEVLIIPRESVSCDAALRAAQRHHWPDHPDQPRPFLTLDEVRQALRPLLTPKGPK